MSEDSGLPTTCAAVRRHLVGALRADLVGPFNPGDESAEEIWDLAPSKRYLCGFLVPRDQASIEDEEDDSPDAIDGLEGGSDTSEGAQNDPQHKRRPMLPSSIGLSVLVPAGEGDSVFVRVSFALYEAKEEEAASEDGEDDKPRKHRRLRWHRRAVAPQAIDVPLRANIRQPVVDTGLTIHGMMETPKDVKDLDSGVRALSLFLVNERAPVADKRRRDEGYIFQATLEVRHPAGLVERPDLASRAAQEWDDQVMDLQFRDHHRFASGHGVAVVNILDSGRVVGARTEWIPEAVVKRVTTRDIDGVEVRMEELAKLESPDALRTALSGIPDRYGAWIEKQRRKLSAFRESDRNRRDVGGLVLSRASHAQARIREGIALLAESEDARRAFRTANEAMARAAYQRSPERYQEGEVPAWRMFQLAFVLLNLPAIVDPEHEERDTVELIFFPTGGGKTEAYLGVIAFTLVWRRMQGLARPDKGLGVAVILRYTLRLLTLDQLGRGATLICALEMLRKDRPELGEERFSLGLWVGKSATANQLSDVAKRISEYKNGSTNLSPFPLAACPWCSRAITSSCMTVEPTQKNPVEVLVGCADFNCDFSARKGGLPIAFVDEQVYRELPAFLIATVDKFAMLPWRGESGALFGRVDRRIGRTFIGPGTPAPKGLKGTPEDLPQGLRPPELIVQDELHLISGPLGTMVGLYETAVDALSAFTTSSGKVIKPKIIASTATVKRAQHQIEALYGRNEPMAMFPPPGIDDSESFFAQVDSKANGRLYLGVAAAGRSMKAVLVTVYAALLAAAEKCADRGGLPGQPCDPYMTLVGYFNNLRELGGMRRLVEDLIRARAESRGDLKPINADHNPWMENRTITATPVELTSRESTSEISRSKDRLERKFLEEGFVPTVLASNMISVGVDIDRLGTMVVAGQPKSTSEYIQASSRVGRDDKRPGLVVTCYNLNKPRDRSYYEHFIDYHTSFYREVESTSVTPFSGPALERGLAGCLIAMVRHADPTLSPPNAAMEIATHKAVAERAVQALVDRALAQPSLRQEPEVVEGELRALAQQVLDRWATLVAEAIEHGASRCYSPYDVHGQGVHLLITALDAKRAEEKGGTAHNHFVAPTSMRDVEPTVHLWLRSAGATSGRQS